MNKISNTVKEQFDIACLDIEEINIGLSADMNYKIQSEDNDYFLKVYDKKKAQASIWTENIDSYMPILIWLNENTNLQGKIVSPLKTNKGSYRFDDEDSVFLLFEYIEGDTITANHLTQSQIIESAEIMACLHSYSSEVPVETGKIKEDFSVSFCFSLESFIADNYSFLPDDVKATLHPYIEQLMQKNNELKTLADKVKQKEMKMTLCHTDAHYKNFMQSDHLILVDWEGMKLAPVEADLFMFTQKEYWDTFIEQYNKLRPKFTLDNEMLSFYILRRKIEDIWAFIESIIYDNLSDEQRERDLAFLLNSCKRLDDIGFEL